MNSRASHASWERCVGESQWMLTALKIERALRRSMASLPTPQARSESRCTAILREQWVGEHILEHFSVAGNNTYPKERRRNIRCHKFLNPRSLQRGWVRATWNSRVLRIFTGKVHWPQRRERAEIPQRIESYKNWALFFIPKNSPFTQG